MAPAPPATLRVSPRQRYVLTRIVDGGGRWLDDAPALLASAVARWSLADVDQLDHGGANSLVFTATATAATPAPAGTAVVLKLQVPHPGAASEVAALVAHGPDVCPQLHAVADSGFTTLQERVTPGTPLGDVGDVASQAAAAASLVDRLHATAVPPGVADAAAVLRETATTRRARARLAALQAAAPAPVLLHGDLNRGNVLACDRRGWVAIDPRPLVGDPAIDVAQLVAQHATGHAGLDQLERAARTYARACRVPTGRISGWAAVRYAGGGQTSRRAKLLDALDRRLGGR